MSNQSNEYESSFGQRKATVPSQPRKFSLVPFAQAPSSKKPGMSELDMQVIGELEEKKTNSDFEPYETSHREFGKDSRQSEVDKSKGITKPKDKKSTKTERSPHKKPPVIKSPV